MNIVALIVVVIFGLVSAYLKYSFYKDMFEEFIQYHTELVDMINKQIESSSSPIFLFGGHIFSQFLIGFGLNVENIINILDNSDIKHNKRLYGTNLIVKRTITYFKALRSMVA